MTTERVTVTLPSDLVRDIDRRERNRSKFIQQAVRREIEHLRREELRRSLRNPHAESESVAALGTEEWAEAVAEGDAELLDAEAGKDVRWEPDRGWIEDAE